MGFSSYAVFHYQEDARCQFLSWWSHALLLILSLSFLLQVEDRCQQPVRQQSFSQLL
jgi:hypothetical protein